MAAMSRGTLGKVPTARNTKSGTATTKNHRFESFSQRIAKLKIEPVRRGRSTLLDDAELDTAFSYFRDALAEWRDRNMSEIFTEFARKAAPLCDGLPQLIHNRAHLMDLLVHYIEKGDKHSEEPLMSLMAHFAHDLGVRFEEHFARAVRTVGQQASQHPDVEVIEWSFTCLAWLFKYLSRLLVPDLRPVFDLMAPLLGREHQKPFVTRFAAESLSFLVRRAGAAYHRDSAPLKLVTKHISDHLQELQGSGRDSELQQGLMALFADSMKGVQRGLHSSAVAILQEMLHQTYSGEFIHYRAPPLEPVLLGVVTAVIHHSEAETFQPLLDAILAHVKAMAKEVSYLGLSSRLLFVVCGVRKGSRVANWRPVLDVLSLLLEGVSGSTAPNATHMREFITVTAAAFQYCPMDAAISQVQAFENLGRGPCEKYFLPFCDLFASLDSDRFGSLVLPYFKRFVTQKAHEYGDNLCLILPELCRARALPESSLQPSAAWQSSTLQRFRELNLSTCDTQERESYRCNAVLDAMPCLHLPQEFRQTTASLLHDVLKQALQVKDNSSLNLTNVLSIGNGFKFLVGETSMLEALSDLWPSFCSAASIYGHYLSFWQALLLLAERIKASLDWERLQTGSFKGVLMKCLGSPSHDMRLAALGFLELIVERNEQLRNIVATAMTIEQSPMDLETQRSVSMRVLQLTKIYPELSSDPWVGEGIPSFLFGLLHVRLASVRDDACSALKTICDTKEGESHVLRIAFEWLGQPDGVAEPSSVSVQPATSKPRKIASPFQCTNIMQLEHEIFERRIAADNIDTVDRLLHSRFQIEHHRIPFLNASSRTHALRVLGEIPSLAEKRSRLLVPILLDWALNQRITAAATEDSMSEHSSEVDGDYPAWTRKEQKAMLSVFSKFTNPKSLYKSAEVYAALLALLANGDVEIQKAALRALLAWRDPAFKEVAENLFNLLDDARFRDEVSVFLDIGSDHSLAKKEYRDRLLPVLLRILYGKVISGKRDLDAKRRAVFQALTRFDHEAIHQFLDIALGPLSGIVLLPDGKLDEGLLHQALKDPRKQIGMLNMLQDMVSTLATTFRPFLPSVLDPLLYCLFQASRSLSKSVNASESETTIHNSNESMFRTIRQRALHVLVILFQDCPDFAWEVYMPNIIKEVVEGRLDQFPIQTAQSVSGLLRLFSAWSKSFLTAPFLVEYNRNIIPKVIECLGVPSAKDEVKCFVLDNILGTLISLVSGSDDEILRKRILSSILQPYANNILSQISDVLRMSPSKEVLESGVQVVSALAPHVVGSAELRGLIEISAFLLKQPSRRVNAPTKLGLLRILYEFLSSCDTHDMAHVFQTTFDAIAPMYSLSQDRQTRTLLCDILQRLSVCEQSLSTIAGFVYDLNSFSPSRLDEPDFDRRARAFEAINGDTSRSFSLMQWQPLVYNFLFFIKDNDELSIRMGASLCLRQFIRNSTRNEAFKLLISAAILPGIRDGMRESSELVRTEFLAVLAQLVAAYQNWAPVADLFVLLSEDEESSFYGNILHIQGHRRQRALRRLASHAAQLQASNVYHILIPLLEHFVFDKADDESASNLAGETVKTIAALCQCLEWPQFRSLLKRYIGYLKTKEDMQKTIIKLIGGLMDSLNEAGRFKGYVTGVSESEPLPGDDQNGDNMDMDQQSSELSKTLPQQDKLTIDVTNNILPELTDFLHKKDESTVSLRVPVAIALTKVLLVLPQWEMQSRLPPLLLDVCHILKSRAQDSRDMARTTLTEIAATVGPNYLGFILKALRTPLQRGYQLHVLSFTLHAILVRLSENLKAGDLNYCLPDIVDIIMEDIFGIAGQEKDSDMPGKMKEAKSSTSYDSMDLVSRHTTPSHLFVIVRPVLSLLQEKLSPRTVQKIDELMRRFGLGLFRNPAVKHRDVLVFCYELCQEVYKTGQNSAKVPQVERRNRKYLVEMKGAAKSGGRQSTTSYAYKFIRFGLDILRTVLRKHEELQTPQNLNGFLPIIGDALVQGQDEVQISAIRLLSTIIRVPMRELDENCLVYVKEAVIAIKGAPSSNSEIAQASLKLISAVLRERPDAEIPERDIALLLKRIVPDLDEPDRQGVTFGFLKAVMNRKIMVPELYEVMDQVAVIMIVNHTKSARELARSSYFQFLMEYPQAKNRFEKQLKFLLKNLRYDHVEGRQSALEAINLILMKVGDNVLDDRLDMVFIPLVHSMANDDDATCRSMAGSLVQKTFKRADLQHLQGFTAELRQWLEQEEDPGLRRLGIQCWGLYLEVAEAKPKELTYVLDQLRSIIEIALQRRDQDDWELIYYSLTVFAKLCKKYPESTLASDKSRLWIAIQACVWYPHAWVKLTAAKLVGTYFADIASTNGESGLSTLPLESSHGLALTEEQMIHLTNASLKVLTVPDVGEDLCVQSVRNLAFLARCFAANGAMWNWQKGDDDDEVEEMNVTEGNDIGNGEAHISDEEEWSGFSPPPDKSTTEKRHTSTPPTAVHRLLTRLSGIIRRETKIMKLSSLYPKSATMTLLETLSAKLPILALASSLPHLLTTLSTLADPATTIPRSTDPTFNSTYSALIDKARAIMSVLQSRMDAQEYLRVMADVQRGVRQRRDERRKKRTIERVSMPERFEKEKKRRNEVKRVKRKEKGQEYRGKRRGW